MILHCNYEELTALRWGARALLENEESGEGRVLAPSEERARVEAFVPHLAGDMSIATLHELRGVQTAISAIVECLRVDMEHVVVATHAADETAVAAYFDFAHGLTVTHRLREMASEMTALIELVTGAPPSELTRRTFQFPD